MNVFSAIKNVWDGNKKAIIAGAVAVGTGLATIAGAVLMGGKQTSKDEENACTNDGEDIEVVVPPDGESEEKTEEDEADAE